MKQPIDQKKKPSRIDRRPIKTMTIHLTFRTDRDLANHFNRIRKNFGTGTAERLWNDGDLYADYSAEYFRTYNYEQRIINGQPCHVYRSKV